MCVYLKESWSTNKLVFLPDDRHEVAHGEISLLQNSLKQEERAFCYPVLARPHHSISCLQLLGGES